MMPLWSPVDNRARSSNKKTQKQCFYTRSLVWVSLCYCKLAGRCGDYSTRTPGRLLACSFLFVCVLWLFSLFLTLRVTLFNGSWTGLSWFEQTCLRSRLGNVLFSSFKSAFTDSKGLGQPGHQLPQTTLTTFIWKDSILKDEDSSLVILMSD